MDLSDFYKEYNKRGEGGVVYSPKMREMLHFYAYCKK